jgi:hypothetical protein
VYGVFAQAHWLRYVDKAGIDGWENLTEKEKGREIEEFNIQCSDWWEDLAEKEQE